MNMNGVVCLATCEESGREASLLNRIVGSELNAQLIANRRNHRRNSWTTKQTVIAVLVGRQFAFYFNTIVFTIVLFHINQVD